LYFQKVEILHFVQDDRKTNFARGSFGIPYIWAVMVQVASIPGEKGVLVLMGRMVPGPQEPWEPKGLFLPWGSITLPSFGCGVVNVQIITLTQIW
jgi:hypothetical protein